MLSAARYQTTQQKINNTRQRIANGNVRDMEVWELIWELQPHFHPSLSLFVQLFSDDTAVKDTHVIRLAQSIFTKSHHIEHKTISGYWDLIAIFVQKRSFLHVDYPDLFHDIIVSFRRYIESHPNPRKSFEFTCERLEPWMLADIRLQGVVSLIVFNQAFDYTSVLQQISNGINPAAIGYQKLLFERIRHLNSMLFNNSAPLPEYQYIANVYRLYLQAYGAGKSSKNCVGQFLFYLQLFDAIWSIEAMTMNSKLELVGALHGLLIEHNVIIPSILQHEKLFESHWSSFVDTALKYYSDSQSSARGFPKLFSNVLKINHQLLAGATGRIWKFLLEAGEESKDACVQWLLHYHSLGDLDIFLEQMIENIPQNMTVNFTCIIQNANFFIQFAESVKELTDSKQTRIAEIILDSIEKLLPVNVDSSAKHSKKRKRSRKEQTVTPYLEWLVSLFSWAKAGFNHSILADVDEKLKRICELARHILGIDRSDVAAWLVLSNVCEWASYKDLVQPDMNVAKYALPAYLENNQPVFQISADQIDDKDFGLQLSSRWIAQLMRSSSESDNLVNNLRTLVYCSLEDDDSLAGSPLLNLHFYEILPDPDMLVSVLKQAMETAEGNQKKLSRLMNLLRVIPWKLICGPASGELLDMVLKSTNFTAEIESCLQAMLSFIDLSDAAMDTVEHLISVTNLEPSANYSVIELLVQALWRNSANAERLLRFLQKSILNDHTSSNLQKWMRLVLHRLRLTDAKKLPPGTKEFLETIQSLALRYLNSDDIDSIQTAIVLLYCQLTDDPSLIPHLERIVDSVDKKKQAALLILASIDRLSASRLQLACEQIGFNRFTKPLIDAIAESDQAASFWTLISDQFTIDGNSAEILCRLLQNNKKLVEAAQAMLPVFLDKVQRIPVAAIELPHIEFISQIVAIKAIRITPVDLDRIISLLARAYLQTSHLEANTKQRIMCKTLIALVKHYKSYVQSRIAQLVPLLISLMDYHRSKAYEGDVIEKNANMYYRIVSLLCAPIYRPVIKKHMMVLVSNYANVISAQGYSASPFRVESRRWIREAIYCAIDASGERDIENTRALCGMDARLVLKSLWEEYSKFFKFKGKV